MHRREPGVTWQAVENSQLWGVARPSGRGRDLGGSSMDVRAVPRRTRRVRAACVVLVAIALVTAMASVAGAKPRRTAGPGRGRRARRPRRTRRDCGPDGQLAYPYQQRAPCTSPAEEGREQRRRDDHGRHEGHDQGRAVPRHPRPAAADVDRARSVAPEGPRDRPDRLRRGHVPRLERGPRPQLQHVGPQVRVRDRQPHRGRRGRAARRRARASPR